MSESFELIEIESKSMLDRARELSVTCDEEYSLAGQFVMGCKSLIAKIKSEFAEPKRKTDEAHKAITAMERRTLEPVMGAMELASNVALTYKREQDRLARQEADRIETERRRQEEETRLAEAERLESEGKTVEAQELIAAPIPIARPTRFETSVPKVDGLSSRATWKARIINPRLVKREFCVPDQALINMYVNKSFPKGTQNEKKTLTEQQRKQLEDEIGGISVYLDEQFSGRVGSKYAT